MSGMVNVHRVIGTLLLIVVSVTVGVGQARPSDSTPANQGPARSEQPPEGSSPRPSDATPANEGPAPSFEALRRQAFDAFYNLDYETAGKLFEQITALAPDHPAGYLYMATQVWIGQLNRTRRLQTGLYSSASFYSKTPEPVDPQVDQQFRDYIRQSIQKAEARLQQNARDTEARYFLGAAYGALAGYEASVARQFFSALKNGSRSVEEHRKVVQQDPTFADAYLTIGLYDYIVGSLPMWAKVMAALGGMRGSKERGIEQLRRAATEGRFVNDDARVLLIAIYAREGRYQHALDLLNQLAERYPRNYYLPMEAAIMQIRIGRKQDGFNAFEALLQNKQFDDVKDLLHFQYAQTLAANGYHVAALHHYRHVTAMPWANRQLVSLAHLRIGQLHDLKGERDAAIAAYKTVLSHDNVFDSHEQAQRYMRKPYMSGGE